MTWNIVGNINILNNTNQYCPKLTNNAQYCQILPNIAQYMQILSNIVLYCSILLKWLFQLTLIRVMTFRYCQILSNISKYWKASSDILFEHFPIKAKPQPLQSYINSVKNGLLGYMQVWKYTSMQVCRNAGMQVCKYIIKSES